MDREGRCLDFQSVGLSLCEIASDDIGSALWGFMLETVFREQDSWCGSLAAVPPMSLSSRIEEKKRRMKVSRPVDMHKIPWSPCCYRQFVVDIWSHSDRLWYLFYRICSDKGQRYNVLPLVLELAIVISRVAVTFLLKSPVALWFRLQLIGLWFQKLPVRSMSVNVTQHSKSIPHLWKWFHVKMTNYKRFAGLWLKHHWETPHNLLRSRSNQPTPCSASMVAGRSRGFEDLPVDVTLAEGCLLFESWCLHTRRYLIKQKLWGIFEMCGRATHIRCSAVSKSTLELHFHRTDKH